MKYLSGKMRGLGVDPGTKSFDICGIEDGEIFYENILDSSNLAENPTILVEAIEEAMPLDLIAAPSGYGVEITYLRDLDLDILEDWYLTYILLLRREDLETALEENNPGIMVYSAMTQSALEMKRKEMPACYIPGVINLPTVPEHRKINNLDMGTVDKLCCAVLGIQDQSKRLDIPYSETSFILAELGAGYNAAVGVQGGKVVDGIGGTMPGMGFLTSGEVDLEMVQMGEKWDKTDVFTGGAAAITGDESIENFIERRNEKENYEKAWNRMMEDVERMIASINVSVSEPKEILLSGRLSRIDEIRDELVERLEKFSTVRGVGFLPDADKIKEAAQGYGMIAEGLAGGQFSELVDKMEIEDAKGTALDYVYHPTGESAVEKIKNKVSFRP